MTIKQENASQFCYMTINKLESISS